MFFQCFVLNQLNGALREDDVFIDVAEEVALAGETDALITRVADKLLAGRISATLRQEIAGMVDRIPANSAVNRAAETIYLIVASPEYAYQL